LNVAEKESIRFLSRGRNFKMRKIVLFLTVLIFVPCLGLAAPYTFVGKLGVTDLRSGPDYYTEYAESAVFRMVLSDEIRRFVVNDFQSSLNPVVELQKGESLPYGTYYYEVLNWSVTFTGDVAFLGSLDGTGGGFRWTTFDGGYGPDWQDDWAFLYPSISYPVFAWNWNFTDPGSPDYLRLTGDMMVGGIIGISDGTWGISGNLHQPVPEPSTMLLLGSGLAGLVGFGSRRMKKLKSNQWNR
jgi:hypothetical protein